VTGVRLTWVTPPELSSFYPRPARDRWADEAKLRSLVINEAQSNVSKEHVVHAVLLLDPDRLSLERVPDRDQRAAPANSPARRNLAHGEVSWVLDGAESTRELALGRCIARGGCFVVDTLVRALLVELLLERIEARLLRARRRRRWSQCLLLQRPVHALVSPVLFRVAGLDALIVDFSWSPDASTIVVVTGGFNLAGVFTSTRAYVARFGDGLPEIAVEVTDGMPEALATSIKWSPSGKLLGLERDHVFYVVDYLDAGGPSFMRVSPDSFEYVEGWFKSDDELVLMATAFGRRGATTISLARRNGNLWTTTPLVNDLEWGINGALYGDGTTFGYSTDDAATGLLTLWTVRTTPGHQPVKITGPNRDHLLSVSPDFSKFALGVASTEEARSVLTAGSFSELSSPRPMEQHVDLSPIDSLGDMTISSGTALTDKGWAPDSSALALFQQAHLGRQLLIHRPGNADGWEVMPVLQSTDQGGYLPKTPPLWSPDSKVLALATRTSPTSTQKLTLISAADSATFDFESTPSPGFVIPHRFSRSGQFLLYVRSVDGKSFEIAYLDLREGLDKAGKPVALPGPMDPPYFAPSGTGLVYTTGDVSYYTDLATDPPLDPIRISEGFARGCVFQPLPN